MAAGRRSSRREHRVKMRVNRQRSWRAICLASLPCLLIGLPGAVAQTGAPGWPADKRAATSSAPRSTAPAERILRPGQPLRLRLSSSRERLSFRIAPEAGAHFVVVTRNLASGVDTVLELLDQSGRILERDDDGGDEPLASSLEVGGARPGSRIRVQTIGAPGEFEILLTRATPAAPPDFPTSLSAAQAAPPLAVGTPRRIRLQRGQTAFFALPEDTRELGAMTRNLARRSDTVLALVDASGRVISEDDDGGDEALASYLAIPQAPRPLFLRASGIGNGTSEFDLVLEPEAPVAPPDFATTLVEASHRPPLEVGSSRRIELRRGQTAYFALPEGDDLFAITRNLAPGTDTVLHLVDGNGREIETDDDGGDEDLASRLELPGVRTGLFLRAGSLNGRRAAFDLALEREAAGSRSQFASTIEEARSRPPLAPGQAVRVTLRQNQSAVFALPQGSVALEALTRGLSRGADSVLELLDADGRVMEEDDDGGDENLASRLDIPTGDRPLFLRVRALSRGSFDLLVQPVAPAPPAAFPVSIAEAAARPPLAIGQPMPIELRRRQAAYFALPSGTGLVALTRELGDGTDTVLELLDADGRVIAEDDDGGAGPLASRLNLGAPVKGRTFLRARSLDGRPARFTLVLERR